MAPYNHIIKFDKEDPNGLNKILFQSKNAAIEYILEKGWNLKKIKITQDEYQNTYYTLPHDKKEPDWKIVKNHFQKIKEIPGYKEEWFNKNQNMYQPAKAKHIEYNNSDHPKYSHYPNEKLYEDWTNKKTNTDFLYKETYNIEWEPFFKAVEEELEKNKLKQKHNAGYNYNYNSKIKYQVYNKGKLENSVLLNNMQELLDWTKKEQAFIVDVEIVKESLYHVWIMHKEDLAQLLPERLIVQRFEDIINRRPKGKEINEHNPYKDIEL